MNLIVLTLDLIEENRISLKTEFCQQDTQIRDISLSQELFYILLFNTGFPIQAFSREGILTRCIVKKDSIDCAYCFCLDQQHNILVADDRDSKVKIFSNEGKLSSVRKDSFLVFLVFLFLSMIVSLQQIM